MRLETYNDLRAERERLVRLMDSIDTLLDGGQLPEVEVPTATPVAAEPAAPLPCPPPLGQAKPSVRTKKVKATRKAGADTGMAAAVLTMEAMTGPFSTDDFHTALSTRVQGLRRKRTSDILHALCRKKRVAKLGRGHFERVTSPPVTVSNRQPGIAIRVMEACRALGRPASRPNIIHWLLEHYPEEADRYDNTKVDKALWQLREVDRTLVVTGEEPGIAGPLKLHAVA